MNYIHNNSHFSLLHKSRTGKMYLLSKFFFTIGKNINVPAKEGYAFMQTEARGIFEYEIYITP